MTGDRVGESLYQLHAVTKCTGESSEVASAAAASSNPLTLWHLRFAHLNCRDILKMASTNAVKGLHIGNPTKPLVCEGCIFGKSHRLKFPVGGGRADNVGDLIHADVCGPMHVPTPEGYRYFVLFKDDCSRFSVVKLMKNKNEAGAHFVEFAEWIYTQTGRRIKVLRTDQGTEIMSGNFNEYRKRTGLTHQMSTRYTPQQDGDSERTMRTIMEGVRSSIYTNSNNNQLPQNTSVSLKELWGELLLGTIHVFNRTLTSHTDITPFEKVFNVKPTVEHLRILGCRAYAHIPDQLRKKLDPKAETCWLTGYCDNIKAWRLWNPVTRKIVISRDVTFDETVLMGDAMEDGASRSEPVQIAMEALNLVRQKFAYNNNFKKKKKRNKIKSNFFFSLSLPPPLTGCCVTFLRFGLRSLKTKTMS